MTEALTSEVCVPLCKSTIIVLQEAADNANASVADLVRSICNEWAIEHLMNKWQQHMGNGLQQKKST